MTIDPIDIPDAHELRGWYDSVGATQAFAASSGGGSGSGGVAAFNRADARSIGDITANPENMEKAGMFSCRGTIVHLKGENTAYPGCPNRLCRKKVVVDGNVWRCDKCGRRWEKPEYRYISSSYGSRISFYDLIRYVPSMAVSDHTGQAWLQGFNDVGLAVFDMSADELMEIKARPVERSTASMT